MITLNHKNKQLHIPSNWSEISPGQYKQVCVIINSLVSGQIDVLEMKLQLVQLLSGYERSKKRYTAEEIETINSNLLIVAEMVDFVLKPRYTNPELMEVLSPELQNELQTRFPYQIDKLEWQNELQNIEKLLQYEPVINLNLKTNPLPVIKIGRKKYYGPRFDIDANGQLQTDLLAEEFADALQYYRTFYTHGTKYLPSLIAVLYRQNRDTYSTPAMEANIATMQKTDEATQYAVFYLMQWIQEYLIDQSLWALLFDRTPGDEAATAETLNMGMIESIYSISQAGYGSRNEVAGWNLRDFLNVQIKQLKDAVAQMRAYKMKEHEIAQKLALTPENLALL